MIELFLVSVIYIQTLRKMSMSSALKEMLSNLSDSILLRYSKYIEQNMKTHKKRSNCLNFIQNQALFLSSLSKVLFILKISKIFH